MNVELDVERLLLARKTVRAELLAERASAGHWVGQISSSPLATAAAISALVVGHRRDTEHVLRDSLAGDGQLIDNLVQSDLCELFVESLHWLARQQNNDGGWSDCPGGRSSLPATLLVQAAFRLTGIPAKYADLMVRADDYVDAKGGVAALRKEVSDKMLIAPVLANCALAGMIPWRQVPTLAFELISIPRIWQRHIQIPISRLSMPTFLAVGAARFHHDPPNNPLTRLLRHGLKAKNLSTLAKLQASDDSYMASPLLTAFVVMNLASIGCQEHPIVTRGVEFLLSSVRADSSWPITTDLALCNSTLVLQQLTGRLAPFDPPAPSANADIEPGKSDWSDTAIAHETAVVAPIAILAPFSVTHEWHDEELTINGEAIHSDDCLEWLLACQRGAEPITDTEAGGWSWSDSPGSVPNSLDTARTLSIVARWPRTISTSLNGRRRRAIASGLKWLLGLQNDDGGWATFYRNADYLQFEGSGVDATASAVRALVACHSSVSRVTQQQITLAIARAERFLEIQQRDDGSFVAQWFGNQLQPNDINPVIGTALVVTMGGDLGRLGTGIYERAVRWLLSAQHASGGWGPPRAPVDYSNDDKDGFRAWRGNETMAKFCTVEETALAVNALAPLADTSPDVASALARGVNWLTSTIEQDTPPHPAMIGYFLARLWYYERLYPLALAAGALERVAQLVDAKRRTVARVR